MNLNLLLCAVADLGEGPLVGGCFRRRVLYGKGALGEGPLGGGVP